ncbi:B12-binding domain-containing radical SAM protein [Patescibacteria group bacterium]
MKISISYPPLETPKGKPTLGQNRQFQWFSSATYIYPMVPASAATLLKSKGYEVFWDDAIAQELTYQNWLERIILEKPDIIAIETKTPVVKRHWEIINELKNKLPNSKIVLMGDHVTTLPEESLKNSQVDFVLTGGDYDFMLLNLANHLSKNEILQSGWYFFSKNQTQNCHPGESRDPGFAEKIWTSDQAQDDSKEIINTGKFELKNNLDSLPDIDRELTQWKLYSEKNGNFKNTPGTYLMSSRDCWWGKCTFCSWTTLYPDECNRTRSVEKVLDEIGKLIQLGVKEIMEDSGTLPVGEWLQDFCHGLTDRGYNKQIKISCNMRINGIQNFQIYQLMKQAGFRMILFGLESANQKTLDKLNKNLKVEEIESNLKNCKSSGLEPHLTIMLGYPWETKQDVLQTLNLAKKLFKKNIIDSLQATIVIPYPGTPLYNYCKENNLLLTQDYDKYDQREQVIKTELSNAEIKKMTQEIYKSFVSFKFILKKIISIRSFRDVKYFLQVGKKFRGHLLDFSN